MATVTKKDKFFEVLRNIFVGAKIEGNSGYVNLMKIKSKYYNEFKEQLHTDIDAKLKEVGQNFEEELYNKLFTFFKKYFSESGSIYFSYTPLQEKVYERIYRDDKDVMLFWKTHMLYYVKTERLFKNMEVEDEEIIVPQIPHLDDGFVLGHGIDHKFLSFCEQRREFTRLFIDNNFPDSRLYRLQGCQNTQKINQALYITRARLTQSAAGICGLLHQGGDMHVLLAL